MLEQEHSDTLVAISGDSDSIQVVRLFILKHTVWSSDYSTSCRRYGALSRNKETTPWLIESNTFHIFNQRWDNSLADVTTTALLNLESYIS